MSIILEKEFGGGGGSLFDMIEPFSVGFRSGNLVDAIILNGTKYGGGGGIPTDVFTLSSGDYWKHVEIRAGRAIDQIVMLSNEGIELGAGRSRGGKLTTLSNIRLLEIGGRSGRLLDNLRFKYFPNFHESSKVASDVNLILEIAPEGASYEVYEEISVDRMNSIASTTVEAFKAEVSSSAKLSLVKLIEGEFSFNAGYSKSITTVVTDQLTQRTKNSTKETINVQADHTAFQMVFCDIYKDENGKHWFYPTSETDWVVKKKEEFTDLFGSFFLSPGVVAQTKLPTVEKFGFKMLAPSEFFVERILGL